MTFGGFMLCIGCVSVGARLADPVPRFCASPACLDRVGGWPAAPAPGSRALAVMRIDPARFARP